MYKKTLESFGFIYSKNKDFILFLNLATFDVVDAVQFLNSVNKLNLNPTKIVIEYKEYRIKDIEVFNKFIKPFKDCGFLIALDDITEESPNLSRFSIIKPDLVKIDMSLIKEINKDYHKQEVVRSIVNLSHKLNSLVVAEGGETEEEVIQTHELRVDMHQGYYFSKPQKFDADIKECVMDRIDRIACKLKNT